MTDSDDTARAKKMPVSRSATDQARADRDDHVEQEGADQHDDGAALNTHAVGPSGMRSSFWTNLAAVGHQLERAVRARPPWGPSRLCMQP